MFGTNFNDGEGNRTKHSDPGFDMNRCDDDLGLDIGIQHALLVRDERSMRHEVSLSVTRPFNSDLGHRAHVGTGKPIHEGGIWFSPRVWFTE